MASAEEKLHSAWGELEHDHAEHEAMQVMGIETLPSEGTFYRVKCSCGEVVRVSLQAVLELVDAPEPEKKPEAPKSSAPGAAPTT